MWYWAQCWNGGLAQELLWVWAGAVALHDCKLDPCTEGRYCWQLLGGTDPDAGTCWGQEGAGAARFSCICSSFTGYSGLQGSHVQDNSCLPEVLSAPEQRGPATFHSKNVCWKTATWLWVIQGSGGTACGPTLACFEHLHR